jgi:hypothetical protein
MVGAMSAIWIGFIGVIIGSVITIAWSWLDVVRKELSDAMVAARLVDENLASWMESQRDSCSETDPQIDHDIWEANRAALARVLGEDQWAEVSVVYRHRDHLPRDSSLASQVDLARRALHELVAGKRYVVPQRWRNMIARHRTAGDLRN